MAAKRKTSRPSKKTEPRRYAEVRLERLENALLTVKATIDSLLRDVADVKELLAPEAEEKAEDEKKSG